MKVLRGDCRAVMRGMEANSVDAIVTDPPYELGFMGKSWDRSGIAFDPATWAEALRVLKPGGHMLAFSGSRTYHRMACAIEDAGFEVRDQIMWVYGSGFPKSHDVSKGIDKAAGAEREVVGQTRKSIASMAPGEGNFSDDQYQWQAEFNRTAPATDAAREWEGWGTALKPAHEPIVVARKPLSEKSVAANVIRWGTGAINVDGCRVGMSVADAAKIANMGGFGRANYVGAKGVALSGSADGSLNKKDRDAQAHTNGRWPANLIHDGSDEVLAAFPESKSPQPRMTKRSPDAGNRTGYGTFSGQPEVVIGHGDAGSAARFFYCAKASKKDRDDGLQGMAEGHPRGRGTGDNAVGSGRGSRSGPRANIHPTVKPTALMRYLCRLVTPPGGTVFDPFTGSGSTGRGAVLEGFTFIGAELSAEYATIARRRIKAATEAARRPVTARRTSAVRPRAKPAVHKDIFMSRAS